MVHDRQDCMQKLAVRVTNEREQQGIIGGPQGFMKKRKLLLGSNGDSGSTDVINNHTLEWARMSWGKSAQADFRVVLLGVGRKGPLRGGEGSKPSRTWLATFSPLLRWRGAASDSDRLRPCGRCMPHKHPSRYSNRPGRSPQASLSSSLHQGCWDWQAWSC